MWGEEDDTGCWGTGGWGDWEGWKASEGPVETPEPEGVQPLALGLNLKAGADALSFLEGGLEAGSSEDGCFAAGGGVPVSMGQTHSGARGVGKSVFFLGIDSDSFRR